MAAGNDGTIRINTQVDTSGAKKGLGSIQDMAEKVGGVIKQLGATIIAAFAVKSIAAFSKECIELGSDLDEVQNVVDVTFGELAWSINDFAQEAAEAFGLSELSAKQYTSTIGAMLKSMGFAGTRLTDMSTMLASLAGDMASFYNLETDEAFAKIRAGISGETEPLKQLGINLSEANLEEYRLAQGITTAYKAMSEQEKVLLRYNYLLDATKDAHGDFARTANSWANQTRVLNLQLESIKANLGKGLINLLTPGLRLINTMLAALAKLASAFKAFTVLITGKDQDTSTNIAETSVDDVATGYEEAADAASDYADSVDDAADATKKAAKEAKAYASPLDHINKYQQEIADSTAASQKKKDKDKDKDSTGGTIGGAVGNVNFGKLAEGETVVSKLAEKIQALVGYVKSLAQSFKEGFKIGTKDVNIQPIESAISRIGASLSGIFGDKAVQTSVDNYLHTLANSLGQQAGALVSMGVSSATNITGGIAQWLEQDSGRIKQYIVSMFDIASDAEGIKARFATAVANIYSVVGGENGQKVTANILSIFSTAFMGVTQLLSSFSRDVLDLLTRPFIDNQEQIRSVLDGLLGVFARFTGTIQGLVSGAVTQLLQVYNQHIKPLVDSVASGISALVSLFLGLYQQYILPVIQRLETKFEEFSAQYLEPLISDAIALIGDVCDNLKVLWENILKPFFSWLMTTLIPIVAPIIEAVGTVAINVAKLITSHIRIVIAVMKGIINFLTKVFQGDWDGAWQAIQDTATNVWNIIKNTATDVWNSVTSTLTANWNLLKARAIQAFGNIQENLGLIWENIKTGASEMWGHISKALTDAWDAIKATASEIWGNITSALLARWELIKARASQLFGNIQDKIVEIWDSIKTTAINKWEAIKKDLLRKWNLIVDTVTEKFESIRDTIAEIWGNVKKKALDVWDDIKKELVKKWNLIIGKVQSKFNTIRDTISDKWDEVLSNATELWENIKGAVTGKIDEAKDAVSTAVDSIKTTASDAWDSVKSNAETVWNDICSFITTPISNALDSVTEAATGIKDAIVDALDSASTAIKTPVNWIISVLNHIIWAAEWMQHRIADALTFRIDLPGWLANLTGYSGWSWSMPYAYYSRIPRLAQGAVIPPNAPFAAMLGDQKNGRNLEAPEGLIRQIIREESGGKDINLNVYLDGKVVYSSVINQAKEHQRMNGMNPFELA